MLRPPRCWQVYAPRPGAYGGTMAYGSPRAPGATVPPSVRAAGKGGVQMKSMVEEAAPLLVKRK